MQTIPPARALTGVAIVILLLVLPSSAGAAVAWGPASTLATGSGPQVAAQSNGTLTAVWRSGSTIKAATKAPGAVTFGPAVDAGPGADGDPRLAVNARGDAVVVYLGADNTIHASYRAAGGAWSAKPAVSDVDGRDAVAGIDAAGNATFAWVRGGVAEARRLSAGGTLSAVQTLDADDAAHPAIAVAPGGAVALAWIAKPGGTYELNAARQGAGAAGLDGAFETIDPQIADVTMIEGNVARPVIAVDGSSRFTMAFWRNTFDNCPPECGGGDIHVTTRDGNGGWVTSPALNSARTDPYMPPDPAVAADGTGNAALAWTSAGIDATTSSIIGRTRAGATGSWAGEQTISANATGYEARDVQVTLGPQGRTAAVWRRNGRIEASIGAPRFVAAKTFTAAGALGPQVAWGSAGDPVALWERGGKIEMSRYGSQPTATTRGGNNGNNGNTGNGGGGGGTARPPADAARPIVGGFSIAPRAFKARRGARVRYELSEAATVAVRVERKAAGRRKGRKCVGPTRKNRTKRRCMRWVRAGSVAGAPGRVGANEMRFDGNVRGRRLRAGSYRLVLTARDAAGNRSTVARAPFRIKR